MPSRSGTGAVPERQRTRVASGSNNAEVRMSFAHRSGMAWLKHLRGTRGAQLLEFALVLPFLAVLLVGAIDFGGAYNVKHILTNAAREGARITVSNTLTDSSCPDPTPCSIEAAADAVKQYLTNAGLSAASCINPKAPTSSGVLTWTYSCKGNNTSLTINRGYVISPQGSTTVIPSTQVTLTYPFTWTFGRIIGLLVNGATANTPSTLTSNAVMQNLTS
jgi:Flp pilus assembly protein TadG